MAQTTKAELVELAGEVLTFTKEELQEFALSLLVAQQFLDDNPDIEQNVDNLYDAAEELLDLGFIAEVLEEARA